LWEAKNKEYEKKKTGQIITEEPFINGELEEIASHIEKDPNLIKELKRIVAEEWLILEDEISVKREPRYK